MPLAVAALFATAGAFAQTATVSAALPIYLPGISDSSSPVYWRDDTFAVLQSNGMPILSYGSSQFSRLKSQAVFLDSYEHVPLWIESVWRSEEGVLYAWYHHEQWVCGALSAPRIGALVSSDSGRTFNDLGIILESGYEDDCAAENGYFAGGHGDFTVVLDHDRRYFYIYFSNYSGPESAQGVAVARIPFGARDQPAGKAEKFFDGGWNEPGLGGKVSAIIPTRTPWGLAGTDAYWGPAIHWNTYLNQYVMLLNRSCCEPGWPVSGIHIAFNADLANPYAWTPPQEVLPPEESGWYPQVIGAGEGESDRVAGQVARLYMGSDSNHVIVFNR